MARIKLSIPEKIYFSTVIRVRITDINYGNHLGHDTLISLLQEARVRFLETRGFTELNIAGFGIIMTDLAITYKSEVFYGDELKIEIGACDFTKYGCDFTYRVSQNSTGKDVAIAKTGIVFYDYSKKKIAQIPELFCSLFKNDE